MPMSKKKCCVPGCLESGNSHKTLHVFPNPVKDRHRFNQWVQAIGGDIIGLENNDIYEHRSVCHAHFDEKFCCRFNRLSNIAVPTLNIPGPLSLPKFTFEERRPLRPIETCAPSPSTSDMPSTSVMASTSAAGLMEPLVLNLVEKDDALEKDFDMEENIGKMSPPKFIYERSSLQSTSAATTKSTAGPLMKSPPTKFIDGSNSQNDITMKEDIDFIKMKSGASISKKVKRHVRVTAEEQKLYKKLVQVKIKLNKCRYKLKKQSFTLKAAKNITSNPGLLATLDKLSSTTKLLTMMQFREATKKDKGRRFSLEEKILALSIFKQSPKGYRFLRKLLILPAPQTLAKLISKADVKPGINKKNFSQLKNVAEKMKNEERVCILIFDEMFLKANISYNERKDRTVGFVTDGQETKMEFADHAQVFMLRGVMKNYKQPISYTFSQSATSGQQIAKQIKAIITQLQEAGLIVVGTVCDQGANNRQAIKLLINETRGIFLRRDQEPKENVFLINEQEVVPLYDPPHLLKCIRNNLLTKNLKFESDNVKCTAKWEHLILLHQENPGYKGVRLIPKLTDNHVLPEKISKYKMKVKYATQIFSRTVASNMGYLADKGVLPSECKETADVLLFFDNLFDSFNGSFGKKKARFSKPLLGPATPQSVHHKEWANAKKMFKKMEFVNPITGKIENVPTLINWTWTLDGVKVLLNNLQKLNINSVWMRHLNQDPIENFFGAIRSHGCRNTNPTPEQFESSFTTLLINNMSSVHASAGANCEDDFGHSLYALIVSDNECSEQSSQSYEVPDIIIEGIGQKNDPRILAPLQYVSGYFIKNVKKRIFKSCEKCTADLIAPDGLEYIKYREYAGRQWLYSPTDNVINCISQIQDISNIIIKKCLAKTNLKELLKTYFLMFIEFDFLQCNAHKNDVIAYLLNLSSRFFIFHYCKDLGKILHGKADVNDDEDELQIKAKKYHNKCLKRRIK